MFWLQYHLKEKLNNLKIIANTNFGEIMITVFSRPRCKESKEIAEILKKHGASVITESAVFSGIGDFSVLFLSKPIKIFGNKNIILIADNFEYLSKTKIPIGTIGICECGAKKPLKTFEKNKLQTITCGLNLKSTVTLSSINENSMLVCLQRSLVSLFGQTIEPADFKIELSNNYRPFSVMAACIILLLLEIKPEKF